MHSPPNHYGKGSDIGGILTWHFLCSLSKGMAYATCIDLLHGQACPDSFAIPNESEVEGMGRATIFFLP